MKSLTKHNAFVVRKGQSGEWSFAVRKTFVSIFFGRSNGKWKAEYTSHHTLGIYRPKKYKVLVLGSPKWDFCISTQKFAEIKLPKNL